MELQNPQPPKTPNEWFVSRYQTAYENHGSPFIELVQPIDQFSSQVNPLSINPDFFAAVLGGRKEFGHHVIYYEPELQWYFKDSDQIYKTTTSEKLQNLYRALMIKCAEELPANVHKLNLFHEWRSDKVAKLVVHRAKSILACNHTFFSATSKNQRVKGPEIPEKLARVLVETMLEPRPDSIVTVTQAYNTFCRLAQQRSLGQLKRSTFREMMRDLVRDVHGMSLRNDVPDSDNHCQQAWKGLRLVEAEVEPA